MSSFHFSRWTWVSRYQNASILHFIAAKGDGGQVTIGAIKRAKLQSKCHQQQTNTHFYRLDALPVPQLRQSTEGKEHNYNDTITLFYNYKTIKRYVCKLYLWTHRNCNSISQHVDTL